MDRKLHTTEPRVLKTAEGKDRNQPKADMVPVILALAAFGTVGAGVVIRCERQSVLRYTQADL